jgi:phosphinothricin acetyltransferase
VNFLPPVNFLPRFAQADDLSAIVAIYNDTIASREVTADLAPVSVASRLAWFAEHTPERRPLWVLEADGAIGGWMALSDFHPRAAYRHTAEVSIYLRADMRGKGLGTAFLRHAIDCAPALDIHHLVGLIFGHNRASLKLFESFGFQRWGVLPGVATLDQIERDLVIVGKRLTE